MQLGLIYRIALGTTVLALTACSSGPSSRIDYKEARSLPTLEMPPDMSAPRELDSVRLPAGVQAPQLATPGTAATTTAGRAVLPVAEGMRIERDHSSRWLVVDAPADQLWPRLRDFWNGLGLALRRDDPHLGIMETEWAENRADAPGGFLTGLVRSVFPNAYSAGTRDKYRVRLEPREDGGTEIFVIHYGLEEKIAARSAEIVETAWVVRPSDPELVNEILNRIILHLGGDRERATRLIQADAQATVPSRTRLVGDTLHVNDGFGRTWRRTGLALDEAGLVVEDRNMSAGIYYVTDSDPLVEGRESRGWFRSMFRRGAPASSDDRQQWQVILAGDNDTTRIVVRDAQGGTLPSREASAILEQLAELLR